jgi:hypothetical protein
MLVYLLSISCPIAAHSLYVDVSVSHILHRKSLSPLLGLHVIGPHENALYHCFCLFGDVSCLSPLIFPVVLAFRLVRSTDELLPLLGLDTLG